jgi:hypothetical protein
MKNMFHSHKKYLDKSYAIKVIWWTDDVENLNNSFSKKIINTLKSINDTFSYRLTYLYFFKKVNLLFFLSCPYDHWKKCVGDGITNNHYSRNLKYFKSNGSHGWL